MRRIVELSFSGQADRICDIIVESVIEEYLKRDVRSRLNIHALGSPGMFMLCGTVRSQADFDLAEIIKNTYQKIGYSDPIEPFIHLEAFPESHERLLDKYPHQETVTVNGFASKETREYLPKPLIIANNYYQKIKQLSLNDGRFNWIMPDGKILLTFRENEVEQVILNLQHARSIQPADVKTALMEEVFANIINKESSGLLINSAGAFIEGGLSAGSGISQVRQQSITYGGLFPKDETSFIGKDPWHPAKSGTFFARYMAKELINQFDLDYAYTRLIYATGSTEPIVMEARLSNGKILQKKDLSNFDARIPAIMERWQLQNLPYGQLAEDLIFTSTANPLE